MRRVFQNHSEVCSKWAENSQAEGRAGNIDFINGVVRSYHWWDMARILEDKPDVVLFRNETYSNSTCQHQSCCLYALRRADIDYRVYHVADIDGDHKINVDDYLNRLRDTVQRFNRSHQSGRRILEENKSILDELFAYCNEFDLDRPVTLGLFLDPEYDFIKNRFYKIPGGGELFLPKWIAKKGMDNIEPKDMFRTRNADIRREIIRILGIERICFALNAKTIDVMGEYSLILLDLKDGRRRPFLKMHNPSVPELWHVEGVHPIIKTVQDGLNYRRYGEEMLYLPEYIQTSGLNWEQRRAERWNWENDPINMRIRPEFETSPLFPNPNDWRPGQLT